MAASIPNSTLSDNVEIRNLNTGASSFACMIPRYWLNAVKKDDNIVFFIGLQNNASVNHALFEIYNTTMKTWSTGVLDFGIIGTAIISVNNTIYVAGGATNEFSSTPFNNVWKLIF